MSSLPDYDRESFFAALDLAGGSDRELSESSLDRLWVHYRTLSIWAPRHALVGTSDAGRIVPAHYAESLRALPFAAPSTRLLDLGSGAGFPGWILAAVTGLETWLVEAREKKRAFLRAVSAQARLSCTVLDARVSRRQPLVKPSNIDLVTSRAIRVDENLTAGVSCCLASNVRWLRWEGPRERSRIPGFEPAREIELPHGRGVIREWRPIKK